MFITGLSAFMALWKTIEAFSQRNCCNCFGDRALISCPSNSTWPPLIRPGALIRRMIAWATVLLPQPDSPARPNTSPWRMENETPSTARAGPRGVR